MFRVDDDLDDFSKEIDVSDLEADEDLQRELRSLGWTEELPIEQKNSTKTVKSATNNYNASIPPPLINISFDGLGEIDESLMELTDDDLRDPELLSQLNNIGSTSFDFDDSPHVANNSKLVPEICHPNIQPRQPPPDNDLVNDMSSLSVDIAVAIPPAEVKGNSLTMSGQEARSEALRYKRLGNQAEALKWIRIAKQLDGGKSWEEVSASIIVEKNETGNKRPQQADLKTNIGNAPTQSKPGSQKRPKPPNPVAPPTAPRSGSYPKSDGVTGDRFSLLEGALREAMAAALRDAKRLREGSPQAAADKMREYKKYEQELTVLASRRGRRNAEPALFRWENVVTEQSVENLDIADDQLVLHIEGVVDLNGSLKGQSSKSITIAYDLGIPKENPVTGKVNGSVDAHGNAVINFREVFAVIKRAGKALQLLAARKKATFEVILQRGFFYSSVSLGVASLPLSDLLSKCQCGGSLPIMKEGARKSSAGAAGCVKATIKLRKPLQTPEVIRTEERRLIVDRWPSVAFSAAAETTDDAVEEASSANEVPGPVSSGSSVAVAGDAVAPSSSVQLTAREKADPTGVDWLESNDVLEAELAIAQQTIDAQSRVAGADVGDLVLVRVRAQLILNKLQLLVSSVQNEEVTMEAYLQRIRDRLLRDEALLAHCRRQPEPDDEAIEALQRRIDIMRKEITSAEEGETEES